nr:hypothetical protein [Glycomyces sp. NEAU-S30]
MLVMTGEAHRRGDVDREDPVPGGVVDFGGGQEAVHDARDVGEAVHLAVGGGHDPVDDVGGGEVPGDGPDVDLGGELVERVLVDDRSRHSRNRGVG